MDQKFNPVDDGEPIMKPFAYLQFTLTPTDRQKAQMSTNRPVTALQWEGVRNILHIGKPTDVVALTDDVSPQVEAMIRRLCRERISCDSRTIQEVWRHIKHALVHPEDVCTDCAAVASFEEEHEDGCEFAPVRLEGIQ